MNMIKVMYGRKGTGKTKYLINTANGLASDRAGDLVFIDRSDQLMYDLTHKIRFINVTEFPIKDISSFLGFICGIIAENYDIKGIFIDGLNYIVKKGITSENSNFWLEFFKSLKIISEKYNTDFYITMNGENESIPEYLQEFVA